jgi:DNA-binding transcriptional ArsR family regulator
VGSKAFLPNNPKYKRCAGCGKAGAKDCCNGCLILNDGHRTFATLYCCRECQVDHWKAHKELCREMRAITRAMSLYCEIVEHLLSVTWPTKTIISSITEENGMVTVKPGSNWGEPDTAWSESCTQPAWRLFPHEVASSRDISMATLVHLSLSQHRMSKLPLLEMLVRRKCHPGLCEVALRTL